MNQLDWDEVLKGHRDEVVTLPKLFAALNGLLKGLKPLVARIERLEQSLPTTSDAPSLLLDFHQTSADERGKPSLHHRGEWRGDEIYSRDHTVTHARRVWRCRSGNANVLPGTQAECWEAIEHAASSAPR